MCGEWGARGGEMERETSTMEWFAYFQFLRVRVAKNEQQYHVKVKTLVKAVLTKDSLSI